MPNVRTVATAFPEQDNPESKFNWGKKNSMDVQGGESILLSSYYFLIINTQSNVFYKTKFGLFVTDLQIFVTIYILKNKIYIFSWRKNFRYATFTTCVELKNPQKLIQKSAIWKPHQVFTDFLTDGVGVAKL